MLMNEIQKHKKSLLLWLKVQIFRDSRHGLGIDDNFFGKSFLLLFVVYTRLYR